MVRESRLLAAWRLNKGFPLTIAALLLVNVAAYVVMNSVVAPGIDALERRYIDRQTQMRQARQAGAATPLETYRQGVKGLAEFREAIPHRSEFTALIGEVFALADSAGLDIDRVSYDPKEVAGRDLLSYALVFSVTGKYEQIKRFVHSLEQSPRLIAIEDISLSGGGEAGQEQVSLRIRLSTYFRTDVP